MAKRTLNDRLIKALKPAPAGTRYDVADAVVPGLLVRVTDRGSRTFMLRCRYPGQPHANRRAIGEYGAVTLEQARHQARNWLELIHKGVDPQIEAERQRLAQQRLQENSFAAVAEDFIKRHVSKTRRAADMEREIRQEFVSRWGGRPITEITQHDLIAVLDEAIDRGAPYQAHSLFGHVRRLFNWAIGRGCYGIDRSPCDRLKPKDVIGRRAIRTHTLKDAELQALWRASGKLGYPFGPLFRMLILTGQRRTEVAAARWSEFDLKQKLWNIPAARMKGGAAHTVPLTPDVIRLLESLPRFDRGDFLFSTTFGRKPVSGFSKAKTRLDRKMLRAWRAFGRIDGEDRRDSSPAPWCIHDIRRTMRTHLSALPVTDLVRELVIAHAKPGLHQVYDQHAYLDERLEALTLWNARLWGIVERPDPTKVVELRRGARA